MIAVGRRRQNNVLGQDDLDLVHVDRNCGALEVLECKPLDLIRYVREVAQWHGNLQVDSNTKLVNDANESGVILFILANKNSIDYQFGV